MRMILLSLALCFGAFSCVSPSDSQASKDMAPETQEALLEMKPVSYAIPAHNINSNAKSRIQLALLLDTSNSMDGLIDQAKAQLWKMVNLLATAKKDGESPSIEISLFEYGNDRLSQREGYIRQVAALTNDLDEISERLFELSTSGGDEYCGYVIKTATESLAWMESNKDLKLIIIAGNESFAQGSKDYRIFCKNAIQKGIMINTIFCGPYDRGVELKWKEGASLTDGKYSNINQDQQVIHIETPYDDIILEKNQSLNKTYIWYGKEGYSKMQRQESQDVNAGSVSKANAVSRASFKSKKAYDNSSWDLLDAVDKDEEVLEELSEDELPPELKGKTKEEIKTYVEEKATERQMIQDSISFYSAKAATFRANQNMNNGESLTLDQVMLNSLSEQAKAKGFEIEN